MATAPATPTTAGGTNMQGLADWASPYITSYLSRAQAEAQQPYEAYTGPLTAGASDLQNQAFTGIGSLTVPAGIGQAATTAGNLTAQAGNIPAYQGATFANQFQAPQAYEAGQFTNQFQGPQAYETGTFNVGTFGNQQAQQYMNPYLQSALNPALEESRRQADISRMADAGRLTQAGAFGGSRQAIMESEGRRNLMDKQNQMLTSGYANAFENAQKQFNADQNRSFDAQKAIEESRQFGAKQGMTAAELQAKYGLSAQDAQEASRQFAAKQGMTAAELQAKYGMSAAEAQEASRQFGAKQGIEGLRLGIEGAKTQGLLSEAENKANLANIQQQLAGGEIQRGITSEGVKADLDEYNRQRDDPFKKLQFEREMISGLPVGSVTNQSQGLSGVAALIQGMGGAAALNTSLADKESPLYKLLGNLGFNFGG